MTEHTASELTARTPTPIDTLAEEWLDTMLELTPELHVHLGRPGREADYADRSPDGANSAASAAKSMLARIRTAEPVDEIDRVTRLDLIRVLELDVEQHDAGFWQRDLNVIASPGQDLRDIFDLMPTETEEDWSHIAQRLHNLPDAMNGYFESLRAGIAANNAPAIRQIREVILQAEKLVADTGFFHQLADSATGNIPDSLKADLATGAQESSKAYADMIAFLTNDLAPHAPEEDGVGREFYALASRGFVGAAIDLDETYEWGLEELARMVSEQEAVAREVKPGATVAEAIEFLDDDTTRKLNGTDALQKWMQETSDKAVADLGRTHFDIPEPMRRLECMIAPTQEGGIYYTPPSEDFARAGRMWWSVPEGVTEFDTWRELTTVYHEGVPGHHLQCGLATYNSAELNGWRRMNWNSGHGEGWALYAERLMADLGYLDDPGDRLGMLDGQRMRAARVVVDIGVHLGKQKPDGSGTWTGDDAFGFLSQHVNMNEPFIRFEANRYLGWPGQAPSYKVGQRIWERIRDEFVAANGPDLKEFHKRALSVGSVGLDTLRTTLLN
ncbi:MAG: DUF885 domain-containing protein [Aeromicrobium sp.]